MLLKIAFVCALTNVFTLSLAATSPTTHPVYAKPADVLEACQKASRAGDYPTMVDCYSQNGQTKVVQFLVSVIVLDNPSTLPSGPPPDPAKEAFETKYGLSHSQRKAGESDDQFVDRVAAQIQDPRAFMIEFLSHENDQQPKDKQSASPSELQNVQFEDNGQTAVGKVVQHDGDTSMSQDVKFSKIDGSWKIDNVVMF